MIDHHRRDESCCIEARHERRTLLAGFGIGTKRGNSRFLSQMGAKSRGLLQDNHMPRRKSMAV
jgi:hypothetical protein